MTAVLDCLDVEFLKTGLLEFEQEYGELLGDDELPEAFDCSDNCTGVCRASCEGSCAGRCLGGCFGAGGLPV